MKKIKFAIIGCGRISYRHIEAILANPGAELISVCDLNLDLAKERTRGLKVNLYQDYNVMLTKEDIDIVNVMTPSGMHAEHSMDIINKYKKHLVIEKPMCLNVSEGIKLLETAKRNKVKLFIVHQNRFNKAVQKIKQSIDADLLGKLVIGTIRIRWSRGQAYYDRDPWRGTYALDGGVLTNQAIHHIDLLRFLLGEVESLSAIAATKLVDIEAEDTACVWLRFQNGALGIIEATTAIRPLNKDLEASISIIGEKGTAIAEGASVNKLTTWTLEGGMDLSKYCETPPNVYGFGHNNIIDNAVEALTGSADPSITGNDALKTIKLLSAIYRSIELGGKEIRLKDNPISERLGIIGNRNDLADLYRTDIMLGNKRR